MLKKAPYFNPSIKLRERMHSNSTSPLHLMTTQEMIQYMPYCSSAIVSRKHQKSVVQANIQSDANSYGAANYYSPPVSNGNLENLQQFQRDLNESFSELLKKRDMLGNFARKIAYRKKNPITLLKINENSSIRSLNSYNAVPENRCSNLSDIKETKRKLHRINSLSTKFMKRSSSIVEYQNRTPMPMQASTLLLFNKYQSKLKPKAINPLKNSEDLLQQAMVYTSNKMNDNKDVFSELNKVR
jgi:hypothetical protein